MNFPFNVNKTKKHHKSNTYDFDSTLCLLKPNDIIVRKIKLMRSLMAHLYSLEKASKIFYRNSLFVFHGEKESHEILIDFYLNRKCSRIEDNKFVYLWKRKLLFLFSPWMSSAIISISSTDQNRFIMNLTNWQKYLPRIKQHNENQ